MFDVISAEELAERLDSGESFTLIDTRPEDSYEAWHVPGAVNLPFGPVETLSGDQREWVRERADGGPVVTICGKGATSTTLAAELDDAGFEDVHVVKGGMQDWNGVYERAAVDAGGPLEVVQFQRRAKGCLSYLVGDSDAGEAVVVDPTRHVEQFVVAAAERGWTVVGVLDTHVHADHVSGGRDLAARLNVPYYLGAEAADRVEFDFEALEDGESVAVGDAELTALRAPGHTPEMVAYRAGDALLTGDTLFAESVGRTELAFGEGEAEEGAHMLYETLHGTFADLPDDLVVCPGHVGVESDGDFAAGAPGEPVTARLGELFDRLDLLGLDEEAFVRRLVDELGEQPANYETIIDLNRGASDPADADLTSLETGANNCAA